MDDTRRFLVTRFTSTNTAATLWPPATNPRTQATGVSIRRDDPRLSPWPCVGSRSQLPQRVIDEALRRIESGEVLAPSSELYELAGDETFAYVMSQVGDACDDGKNPYLSGIPDAIKALHVVRLLNEGRPAAGEDVLYLSEVGVRFVFHSRSGRLLRVEPGLVESRHWVGEFYLSNPLWHFTLSGHDLLDSGHAFATRLSRHGIVCDPDELDAWLQSGLRVRFRSQAYPDLLNTDGREGGAS